jgi:hypothetical protein
MGRSEAGPSNKGRTMNVEHQNKTKTEYHMTDDEVEQAIREWAERHVKISGFKSEVTQDDDMTQDANRKWTVFVTHTPKASAGK